MSTDPSHDEALAPDALLSNDFLDLPSSSSFPPPSAGSSGGMPDNRPSPTLAVPRLRASAVSSNCANKSSEKGAGLYEWESLGPLATDKEEDWKTVKLQDIYMKVKWRGTDEHTWEPIVNLVQDGNFTQVRDVIFRDLPESTRLGLWHRFQSKNEPPNLVSLFGGKRMGKGAAGPSSYSKVPKAHSPSTEGRSQNFSRGGKSKSPLEHLATAAVADADATDSDHSESVSNVGSASKRGSKKRAKTGAPSINLRYEEIDQARIKQLVALRNHITSKRGSNPQHVAALDALIAANFPSPSLPVGYGYLSVFAELAGSTSSEHQEAADLLQTISLLPVRISNK